MGPPSAILTRTAISKNSGLRTTKPQQAKMRSYRPLAETRQAKAACPTLVRGSSSTVRSAKLQFGYPILFLLDAFLTLFAVTRWRRAFAAPKRTRSERGQRLRPHRRVKLL